MMNKLKLPSIVFLVLIFATAFSFAQIERVQLNKYTISQLNQALFTFGTYETEGYVVAIYSCPPCLPKGLLCETCIRDNIIISEDNKKFYYKDDILTEKELIVFVNDSKEFKIGTKYKFLIQIMDVKSTSQALNNLKLIYYEESK